MAVGTLRRCVLIDHDLFVFHHPGLLVALVAGHIGVSAGKWEVRLGVVVESRGFPSLGVMAVHTMRRTILRYKLSVVCVLVAGLAFLRSALKTRFGCGCRFMAVRAGYRPMCAKQRELRL